jgi:hypothetical protein
VTVTGSHLELGRLLVCVGAAGGEQVQEHLQELHVLAGHVGHLDRREKRQKVTWKMGQSLSLTKFVAESTTSSAVFTMTGTYNFI